MRSLLDTLVVPLGRVLRHRRNGEKFSVLARPGWDAPETITLRSDSFQHGESIDDRHSMAGKGKNLSPQLSWTGVPAGARQLVLVLEDLDLPFHRPGLHTLGILAPETTGAGEGELTTAHPTIRWVSAGLGSRGAYLGPRPLPGHGPHRYRFHLLALDTAIDPATPIAGITALDPHVAGRVIARGMLEGHQTG